MFLKYAQPNLEHPLSDLSEWNKVVIFTFKQLPDLENKFCFRNINLPFLQLDFYKLEYTHCICYAKLLTAKILHHMASYFLRHYRDLEKELDHLLELGLKKIKFCCKIL